MKVLVCGGRDYNEFQYGYNVLDKIHEIDGISMIIHGDARGADTIGKHWAFTNQIPYLSVPAEWNRYGKSAGYKRNSKMLEFKPDVVVAFPGGKGTEMMCDLAENNDIPVWYR